MNTLAAAVELLKSLSAVTAIVGTRVYGVNIPGGKDKFPCVMVRRTSGGVSPSLTEGPIEDIIVIDIRCFGNSQIQAQSIADAINNSILGSESVSSTNYRLAEAMEQMSPIDMLEDVTDSEKWNVVFMTHRWVVEEI